MMRRALSEYCAGQTVSLTRANKLKLWLLAKHYKVKPSQIMNKLLDETTDPAGYKELVKDLDTVLNEADVAKGNAVFHRFLAEHLDPESAEHSGQVAENPA